MSDKIYYLSIGSNIQPEVNIPICLRLLRDSYPSVLFSQVYETDPVGPAGTAKFWNLAAAIKTSDDTAHLRIQLREIESKLGRVRSPDNRFLPRVIDIDILPQPEFTSHAFIMIPLSELAPSERDQATGKTFAELAEELRGTTSGFKRMKVRLDRI